MKLVNGPKHQIVEITDRVEWSVSKSTWEAKFRTWAAPPSQTEEERCLNAVNAIRNAINASDKLRSRQVSVVLQGSYNNNTNCRGESDVDVGVVCPTTFFYKLPDGLDAEQFKIAPSDYNYPQFKDEVGAALVSYFGKGAVSRGNKAFDVRETSYHVEADVAPFFVHRRYAANGSFEKGVELRPDNGKPIRVINWPDQHYKNGVEKNNSTGRRYKSLVRVLKTLRKEMCDSKISAATPAIGFLSECLIWNAPNTCFGSSDLYDDLRSAIVFLYSATKEEHTCNNWGEVSELKYLFRQNQKWTREQANDFLLAVWQFVGFK